jgi:ribosomal protein S18 acetylase RimI-like enzyme
MDMDDFARAAAFDRWLEDALASELGAWAGGTVVLDRAAPDLRDSNHLRLERPWDDAPERFPAAVEEACRAFGLRTPVVDIADPAQVERLDGALRAAGYTRQGVVFMAARATPERPDDVVSELDDAAVRPHRRAHLALSWQTGEPPTPPALVDQRLAVDARIGAVLDDRWFAVREGGALVAMCRLMSRGDVGQVEDVSTLPTHRNRGYAGAVVGAAVIASQAAGHTLTFIAAHEDDWPRGLYAKLGFVVVGTVRRFRRT